MPIGPHSRHGSIHLNTHQPTGDDSIDAEAGLDDAARPFLASHSGRHSRLYHDHRFHSRLYQVEKMLHPVQKRLRHISLKKAFWAILAFATFTLVLFITPETRHSNSNEMLFYLAAQGSPLRSYPVPLTAGVIPKRFHSHNDYEQSIPLLKALSYGAGSVEADIWLRDGELLVAHTIFGLSNDRKLSNLYLEPLVSLLEAANEEVTARRSLRGIYETAPGMSLILLIDIKTEAEPTFDALYAALAPLRRRGYLTTLSSDGAKVIPSAITVIGTGNTPLSRVQSLGHNATHPRDVFLDAPLHALTAEHNSTVSPLASTDFAATVGSTWMVPVWGRSRIRSLVQSAREKGIQSRLWNSPIAPKWARNFVWQMLLDEGVDWLNVDDLPAARDF